MIPQNPKVGDVFDLPLTGESMSVIVSEVRNQELVVLGLDGKYRMVNIPKALDITAEEFKTRFGVAPEDDDLDRVNCLECGPGHFNCGVCETHNLPRFTCGCIRRKT